MKAPLGFAIALILAVVPALGERVASAAEATETDTDAPPAASPDVAAQTKLKTEKEGDAASPSETPKAKEPKPEDQEAPGEEDAYGHGFQLGIRAGVTFGYKMDFRYAHSPLCQANDPTKKFDDQQKICGFGAPPGTEIALSFGVLDSVEPYVFGRFGFSGESKTNTKPIQLLGVGVRVYTMSDSRLKIYVEPALAYEMETGAGNPNWAPAGLDPAYKKDLVFHVGVGPQYDFAKAFGIFLNGGVDVGVLRAISATLLVNVGAQLRFL